MSRTLTLSLAAVALACSASTGAWSAEAFRKTLEREGISFAVEATNDGSINQLKISPSGLTEQNEPVMLEIEGTVSGAEAGDLDSNGFPEIYVYITSAGSGSYGALVAYAVNNGKSMTPIYLPPIADDPNNGKGYMGHDEFTMLEGVLGHRFPVYETGDTGSTPTGKTRQLQYKLKAGEAGWALVVDKVTEF
jgi:hypothetical protein